MVFGRLAVLEPWGGGMWKCRCDCGTELCVSQDHLLQGSFRSCGCAQLEQQNHLQQTMTFVDNTCLEVLERRKFRSDNTSGFRGVTRKPGDRWLVTIGMQGKRYYVGLYDDFDDAVKSRCHIEKALHHGFLETYRSWQNRAGMDDAWAKDNPFFFDVEKIGKDFHIHTVLGSTTVRAL